MALALALGSWPAGASAHEALELPPGFQATTLHIPRAEENGSTDFAHTLQYPTAIDFAPDGQMFIAERNGRVAVLSSVEDTTPTLVANLAHDVMGRGDRGLLGLKLDPEYPAKPYLYLAYTHNAPIGGEPPTGPEDPSGGDGCDEGPPYTGCVASGRIVRLTLDPSTDIPEGGVQTPVQKILVESWCQQFTSHSIGDIEFDSSGALLAGGGDGASWEVADHGQFSNACGDPPNEGGSLRSQDLRTPETATDPTRYNGTIIRIDRETGEALPDDPLYSGADVGARRILAYGLRNPFRFELRPGTDELYVGDVGWNKWEELDRLMTPPDPGQAPNNFGWPCYEGDGPQADWKALADNEEAPLCKSLYASPPGAVTFPLFTYLHGPGGQLFTGDTCTPGFGASTTGLAFYEPVDGTTGGPFPAPYDGALFLADSSRGCIWVMHPDAEGKPDPSTIEDFVVHDSDDPNYFTPVDIVLGPDGDLYVPNFFDSSITRIAYFAHGGPPIAHLTADHDFGTAPLTVQFDASGSSDPDGDTLHYSWDTDGDGEFDDGEDSPELTETFATHADAKVSVRVSDGTNADIAQIAVFPGDAGPPEPAIQVSEAPWTVGQEIPFAGTAADPDGEAVEMSWNIVIRHCPTVTLCHSHPLTSLTDEPGGVLVAPSHEYPSHLMITLTATDERGLSREVSKEIYPRVVEVTLASDPAGVPLTFGAQVGDAPLVGQMIAGGNANISAPPTATVAGTEYTFDHWSDGGGLSHTVTSSQDVTLTAVYSGPAGGDGITPPPPVPVPAKSSLRLRSRPEGVRFRVGAAEEIRTPFLLELSGGESRLVIPPLRIRHDGVFMRFVRWSDGATGRRRLVEVGSQPARALYKVEGSRRRTK